MYFKRLSASFMYIMHVCVCVRVLSNMGVDPMPTMTWFSGLENRSHLNPTHDNTSQTQKGKIGTLLSERSSTFSFGCFVDQLPKIGIAQTEGRTKILPYLTHPACNVG